MSERVTWESCPSCGQRAAVGWTGDMVVEFDCVGGCELVDDQLARLRERLTSDVAPTRPGGPPTAANRRA
jgi:hypothetical protein